MTPAPAEDDYLMMSGIQHFTFCRRQWALIHLEQQWSENLRTAQGQIEHGRCHNEALTERRGDLLIVRGMRVVSHRLQLSGNCDVVEFSADAEGVPLCGYDGKWKALPVEYKHGHSKAGDADRLQLCAQAMALEEMLACEIAEGCLFYHETHRREQVCLTEELRAKTKAMAEEMQQYFRRGYTPKGKTGTFCRACSLKELCLPKLCKKTDAVAYISSHVEEAP